MATVEYTALDEPVKVSEPDMEGSYHKDESLAEQADVVMAREDTRTGTWVTGIFHIITAVIGTFEGT